MKRRTEQDLIRKNSSHRKDGARRCFALRGTITSILLTLCVVAVGGRILCGEPAKKLVFVHHSCGENWLSDENGGLGRALATAGYFVSDTNYGWGPDGIGDRTDIPDWPDWFCGDSARRVLDALTGENETRSPYARPLADPGGKNRIVLFKSCFPNSALEGRPDDPPGKGEGLSVGAAKAVYVRLRKAFAARPDLFFVAITAPPLSDGRHAANARAFNTWLVKEWLKGYDGSNVMVFDLHGVLSHKDNHHRIKDGAVEHINTAGRGTLAYPSDDDHPSAAGNRKATGEFVPLLNYYVARWRPAASPVAKPEPVRPAEGDVKADAPALAPPQSGGDTSPAANFAADVRKWEIFQDEGVAKPMMTASSATVDNAACLSVGYRLSANSWASCAYVRPGIWDWSGLRGVSVRYRAPVGCKLILTVYENGQGGGLLHFEYPLPEGTGGWQEAAVLWDRFRQPEWQGNVEQKFRPDRARGVAFILHPGDDPVEGTFHVARVGLMP